jgi:hypothetical protein
VTVIPGLKNPGGLLQIVLLSIRPSKFLSKPKAALNKPTEALTLIVIDKSDGSENEKKS